MKIQNNNLYNKQTPSFKGYDARPLKGLFLRNTGMSGFNKIASHLEQIGKLHGFDVFVQTNENIISKNLANLPDKKFIRGGSIYTWCQDNITFLPNKNFISNVSVISKLSTNVENFFGLTKHETRHHIAGGNYFVISNNDKNEMLLGRYNIGDLGRLTEMLNVSSIKLLSQADFHIDLFIRPLKNKVVLIADDQMWIDRISNVLEKIEKDKTLNSNPKICKVQNKLKEIKNILNTMNIQIPNSNYAPLSKVNQELIEAGYKTVKVPGRIFEYKNSDDGILPNHILNYMNGIVHVNSNDELIYITNKSNLNKYCGITPQIAREIDFDFQSEFINSVKDYINPENIYFVDTQKFLKLYEGGVHCLCAEIPKI